MYYSSGSNYSYLLTPVCPTLTGQHDIEHSESKKNIYITRDNVATQQHTYKQGCLTLTDNISLLSIDNTSEASWFWGPRPSVHYAAALWSWGTPRHLNQVNKLTKKTAHFLDLPLDFLLYLGCAGTLRISLSQRRHFDRYVCTVAFTERSRTWLFSPWQHNAPTCLNLSPLPGGL